MPDPNKPEQKQPEQQGGVVDPVTSHLVGGDAINEAGYTVRPKTRKESFEINQEVLKGLGINSADDPRFVDLHSNVTAQYKIAALQELAKPYAKTSDIDLLGVDPVLIDRPTVLPRRHAPLSVSPYLAGIPAGMKGEFAPVNNYQ